MSKLHKGYANTPYGQIHYRQLRQMEGTPLVLFHQTASSGMMFEPLMALLAESFPTIALDTPGFGASFTPPAPFTIQFLADTLYTALTTLGVERCYAFGHHTGAALAVQMAYDHPDFVPWVVLSGPPLLSTGQMESLRASLKPFALAEDGGHWLATWNRIRQRHPALPLDVVQRELLLTQMAAAAVYETYEAVFAQPFAAQLAALTIPILAISGEHDTLHASLKPAYQLLQHGQMQIIPGAGPYICDTHPQVVAEAIKAFEASVGKDGNSEEL